MHLFVQAESVNISGVGNPKTYKGCLITQVLKHTEHTLHITRS